MVGCVVMARVPLLSVYAAVAEGFLFFVFLVGLTGELSARRETPEASKELEPGLPRVAVLFGWAAMVGAAAVVG